MAVRLLEFISGITILYVLGGARAETNETLLFQNILRRSGLSSWRPVKLDDDVVTVTLDLGIFRLVDFDEDKAELTLNGYLSMVWNDTSLPWDPAEYGGLDFMHLDVIQIWIPDVTLYNSNTGKGAFAWDTMAILYNGGRVIWIPPRQFKVACVPDHLRTWSCPLKFGSWTMDSSLLDLDIAKDSVSMDSLLENSRWQILKGTAARNVKQYPCCEEAYVDVTYTISIKRNYGY